MYVNVEKDTNLMFIILNLGLPPTYPTIMANDFEAGPSHINSDVNNGKFYIILWGPIEPIGTIHMGKGWAYGPIPSPRIRAYPGTINKGRNENYFIGRGKEYLWRT